MTQTTALLQVSLLLLLSLSWKPVSANPYPGIPKEFLDTPTIEPVHTTPTIEPVHTTPTIEPVHTATEQTKTEQTQNEPTDSPTESSSYSPSDTFTEFKKIGEHDDESTTTSTGAPAVDSFHLSVRENVVVEPQGQVTLKDFRIPDLDNIVPGHYRSANIDPINGIFHPKHNGIYLLSASIIIQQQDTTEQLPTRRRRRNNINTLPTVTVAVCINNDCTDNPALLTNGGLTSTETTISIIGTLELKSNQNISVNILNKSNKPLTISNRSSFMAHLLNTS